MCPRMVDGSVVVSFPIAHSTENTFSTPPYILTPAGDVASSTYTHKGQLGGSGIRMPLCLVIMFNHI